MHNLVKHKDNSSTGCVLVVHDQAFSTWIINNEFYDASTGSAQSGKSLDSFVLGNYFHDIINPDWDPDWAPGMWKGGNAI